MTPPDRAPALVAVTDHAAERYRQRVRGTLDPKREIVARITRARTHGDGSPERGARGTLLIRDPSNRELIYVCRPDHDELVVVTVYEQGEDAAVPRRYTDALRDRRSEARVRDRERG